jgi:VanZ family protein
MWIEKKRPVAFILLILTLIEIWHFSSFIGSPDVSFNNIWIPRAYHFIIFFLLAFFIIATIKGNKKLTTKQLVIILILSVIFAILDEIHQSFIPYRDASIRDILIDSIGIFISLLIYALIDWKSRKLKVNYNTGDN